MILPSVSCALKQKQKEPRAFERFDRQKRIEFLCSTAIHQTRAAETLTSHVMNTQTTFGARVFFAQWKRSWDLEACRPTVFDWKLIFVQNCGCFKVPSQWVCIKYFYLFIFFTKTSQNMSESSVKTFALPQAIELLRRQCASTCKRRKLLVFQ